MECIELVKGSGSWSEYRECGKPVKEDGLCGRHLGVKRRRDKNNRADEQASEASKANQKRANRACDVLRGLGIDAKPEYVSGYTNAASSGYSGKVILDPASLTAVSVELDLDPIQPFDKDSYLKCTTT